MPTYLMIGLHDPAKERNKENELFIPNVYLDDSVLQVVDEENNLIVQFTYEEIIGMTAIMEAEQHKKSVYLTVSSKKN